MLNLDLASLLRGFPSFKKPTLLEEKLVDENYPLDEYLQNDEAILCYKDMNKNTKKYFNKEKIKQLIKYITEEPEADDQLKGHKYPYVASEMLKSDCPYILDLFVLNDDEYKEKYKNIEEKEESKNEKGDSNIKNDDSEKNKNAQIGISPLKDEKKHEKNDKIENGTNVNKELIKEEKDKEKKENIDEKSQDNKVEKEEKEDKNEDKKEEDIKIEKKVEKEDKKEEEKQEEEKKEIKKEENKDGEDFKDKKEENKNEENPKVNEEIKDKKEELDLKNENEKDKDNKENEINKSEEIKEKEENKKTKEPEDKNNNDIENEEEKNKSKEGDIEKKVAEKNIIKENKDEVEINDNNKVEEKKEIEIEENINIIEKEDKKENIKTGFDISHNELLDLLLNFIITDKIELNDVLAGYFASVLTILINKYPSKILFYLYTLRKDALEKILFHSYNKSLGTLSLTMLKLDTTLNNVAGEIEKNSTNCNEQSYNKKIEDCANYRDELMCKLFLSINLDGFKNEKGTLLNNIDIEPIFTILGEIFLEKNLMHNLINNPKLYNHLFDILGTPIYNKDEKQQKIYNYYINFATNIFRIINKSQVKLGLDKNLDSNIIDKIKDGEKKPLSFFEKFIESFMKILSINYIDNSSINEKPTNKNISLGIRNQYILEFIIEVFQYMEEKPLEFDKIIIYTKFCEKSINYLFKYQLNNIYQIQFLKFFKLYLNKENEHSLLRDNLFKEMKLHEILVDYINNEENIVQKPRKENKIEDNNKKEEIKNKNIEENKIINTNDKKEEKQKDEEKLKDKEINDLEKEKEGKKKEEKKEDKEKEDKENEKKEEDKREDDKKGEDKEKEDKENEKKEEDKREDNKKEEDKEKEDKEKVDNLKVGEEKEEKERDNKENNNKNNLINLLKENIFKNKENNEINKDNKIIENKKEENEEIKNEIINSDNINENEEKEKKNEDENNKINKNKDNLKENEENKKEDINKEAINEINKKENNKQIEENKPDTDNNKNKPVKKKLSLVYPIVIDMIYKIQVTSGLKSLDENDKKNLNILNLGEFEFIKDENSPKNEISIKTSEKLNEILKSSNKWITTFENKVLPAIKKYESRLKPDMQVKGKPKDSMADRLTSLLSLLTNNLKQNKNLALDKNKKLDNNNKDNNAISNAKEDKNAAEIGKEDNKNKNIISNKIEDKNPTKIDKEDNKNNNIISNKKEEKQIGEDGKEIKNKKDINEDIEITGVSFELDEQSLKSPGSPPQYRVVFQFKPKDSKPKENDNDKNSSSIETEDKIKEYNDINFWEVKPGPLVNEEEMQNLFEEL